MTVDRSDRPAWMRAAAGGLDRLLRLDADAPALLAELGTCQIGVQVDGMEQRFLVTLMDGHVDLMPWPRDLLVDVEVSGPPASLLRALLARDEADGLGGGRLRVRGDALKLQALRRMLVRLDIDWEEWIAPHVGDIAAHQAGNLLRGVAGWWRQTSRDLRADLHDYLTEDGGHLPHAVEVRDFVHEVDRLRDDVERLEQRLAAVQRRRQVSHGPVAGGDGAPARGPGPR